MPAGRNKPDREGRAPQRRRRLAVAELALFSASAADEDAGPALGREEDLEPAQAAALLVGQVVQGLEVVRPGDVAAELEAGVQGYAELCVSVGGAVRSAPPPGPFCICLCDVGTLDFYADSFLFCKADSPRRLGNDSLSVSYTCSGGLRSSKVPLTTSDRNSRSAATIYKSVMSVAYLNILKHQKPKGIRDNSTKGGSARAEEDNIHQRTGPSPPAAAAPGQQTPSRQSSW